MSLDDDPNNSPGLKSKDQALDIVDETEEKPVRVDSAKNIDSLQDIIDKTSVKDERVHEIPEEIAEERSS